MYPEQEERFVNLDSDGQETHDLHQQQSNANSGTESTATVAGGSLQRALPTLPQLSQTGLLWYLMLLFIYLLIICSIFISQYAG